MNLHPEWRPLAATIYLYRKPERLALTAVIPAPPPFAPSGLQSERIRWIPNRSLSGAPGVAIKGRSIVDHRARFSTLNTRYEDFLFAPVCEDANGMRLSVISALARTNVDPWEEATRLAAMPKAIAEKTLLSILDLVSGRSWKSPEAVAIVARLVRLLPQSGEAATMATTGTANAAPEIAKVLNLQKNYWWLWVAMALAFSFMMPHHQAATSSTPAATSESGATSRSMSTQAPHPVGQSR